MRKTAEINPGGPTRTKSRRREQSPMLAAARDKNPAK